MNEIQTSNKVAISTLSIYETMVAISKGKVVSPWEPETLVRRWLSAWETIRIPVSEEIVIRSRSLVFDHADPFDRLIASTAFHENTPLVTADGNLLQLNWLTSIPAQ